MGGGVGGMAPRLLPDTGTPLALHTLHITDDGRVAHGPLKVGEPGGMRRPPGGELRGRARYLPPPRRRGRLRHRGCRSVSHALTSPPVTQADIGSEGPRLGSRSGPHKGRKGSRKGMANRRGIHERQAQQAALEDAVASRPMPGPASPVTLR
ncbi:hypothetical protein SRO_0804 [Streptomyces rochei]|nr:hypothetical protein SRO_0804 [Streptomyces rochei]